MPVIQSDLQLVIGALVLVLMGLIPLTGKYLTVKMENAIRAMQTQQEQFHDETKGVLQHRNDLLGELVEKVNGNPLTITIAKEVSDGTRLQSTGNADAAPVKPQ